MNEMLPFDNKTTFDCICEDGYDGTYCEFVSDMCANIICENNGKCFSKHLSTLQSQKCIMMYCAKLLNTIIC